MSKEEIKKKLLEMAANGEPRPQKHNHPYGRAVWDYTSPTSKNYDEAFRKEIAKLAPNWLLSRKLKATIRTQKKLLDLAVKKAKKPEYRDNDLGKKLSNCTDKLGRNYDAEFTQILKILAPHWFYKKTEDNKRILLEIAKQGGPIPAYEKKGLRRSFYRYTKTSSKSYDRKFKEEIEKYAPDWLHSKATKYKNLLIEMALRKEKRPTRKNLLGARLSSYTSPSSGAYDYIFEAKMKVIAPEWFSR